MSAVLLDTHILVWWRADRGRLTPAQIQTLRDMERTGQPVAISAISLREMAQAVYRGRVEIGISLDAWLEEINDNPLITVLPITTRIAAESIRLGDDFPKDPADQIIVATARCHGLRLMTADSDIRRWGKVALRSEERRVGKECRL